MWLFLLFNCLRYVIICFLLTDNNIIIELFKYLNDQQNINIKLFNSLSNVIFNANISVKYRLLLFDIFAVH